MDLYEIGIGHTTLHHVLVAKSSWQRLRGWYGYQHLPVQGVLLTQCNAVHTVAMPLRLDLLWLDRHWQCIGVQRSLPAWRCAWCRGASHVLEVREGGLNAVSSLQELVGQHLTWRSLAT